MKKATIVLLIAGMALLTFATVAQPAGAWTLGSFLRTLTTYRSATTTTQRPTATTLKPTATTLKPTTTTLKPVTTTTAAPSVPSSGATLAAGTYGPRSYSGGTQKIIGAGIGKTIITGTSGNLLTVSNTSSVEIAHLTIDGKGSASIGVLLQGSNPKVWIHDVEIKNMDFTGIINGVGSLCSGVFERMHIHHNGDFGIQLRSGATGVTIRNNQLHDFPSDRYPAHGVYLQNVNGATVENNTIYNLRYNPNNSNNEISGVKVTDNNSSSKQTIVRGNTFYNSVAAVSLPGAWNVLVENNRGYDLITRGVYFLVGGGNLTVQNNVMEDADIGYALWSGAPSSSKMIGNKAINCGKATNIPASSISQSGNSWQ